MCGIVGYVGSREVGEVLINGLKRLEYRGYDSAGIAYFKDHKIQIKKSEGRIKNVERLLNGTRGAVIGAGIGHTRWATHGKPNTLNAHPHQTGPIVLVHNGIIENYLEIRSQIEKAGHHPVSETDSELFGFLVLQEMEKKVPFREAVRAAFSRIKGQCSVVVMNEENPDHLVGVRNGSPLVAAKDPKGGAILASDAQPLLEYTQDVYFLENGDLVEVSREGIHFFSLENGRPIERKEVHLDWSAEKMDRQGYPHYMLKEIYEQPRTVVDTLNQMLDRSKPEPFSLLPEYGLDLLKGANHLSIVACGTAWHAALLGKYWVEQWAGIPVSVDLASEFRYRNPVLSEKTVVIGVSQSGETADTLAVIRDVKSKKIPAIALTNTQGSTLSREADATFITQAGPEIGVCATKTFCAQMLILLLWAGYLGKNKKGVSPDLETLHRQIIRLPHTLENYLREGSDFIAQIKSIANEVANKKGFFFIGRGKSFPISLEGALKLKEIAYIHAEGYAAGELKHGPIAMIDADMVVVVLAPEDRWYEKTISNLQEVKARGAIIFGVGDPDNQRFRKECDYYISLPSCPNGKSWNESVYPFLLAPSVQLLSYEISLIKGTDPDKPRNLAKSVTVE